MLSALIVTSTRSHADARETLRLLDVARALTQAGWKVDLLVPRASALLTALEMPAAHLIRVPKVPFSAEPPKRPSLRRFVTAALMFLRGTALVARNGYSFVWALNDGALVVRAIDRVTIRRFPYIADVLSPYNVKNRYRGLKAFLARRLEHAAWRHAAAVVFAEADTPRRLSKSPPPARVSIIPEPHDEIAAEGFTRGDFSVALDQVLAYAMRDRD